MSEARKFSNTFTQNVILEIKLTEKNINGWLGLLEFTSPGTDAFLQYEIQLYNHGKEDAQQELFESAREQMSKMQESNPRHRFTIMHKKKVKGTYFPK